MGLTCVPQTTVETMARITAGVDPWIAYRDFLEDWTYLPELRAELMARKPGFSGEEQRRWAALLAASVEALCTRDGLVAPAWTRQRAYRLSEPWYLYEGTGRIRDWLRESTPLSLLFAQHLERRPDSPSDLTIARPRDAPRASVSIRNLRGPARSRTAPTSWRPRRSAAHPAFGRSMVIDPWGTVIAQAPDRVGIIRADVETDRVAAVRRQIPALANRRPEAYGMG